MKILRKRRYFITERPSRNWESTMIQQQLNRHVHATSVAVSASVGPEILYESLTLKYWISMVFQDCYTDDDIWWILFPSWAKSYKSILHTRFSFIALWFLNYWNIYMKRTRILKTLSSFFSTLFYIQCETKG